ncbi:hypothetical protein A2U01_0090252, partial [Trifolium medium]|nr:hypothetical protein [Trifolium medium]
AAPCAAGAAPGAGAPGAGAPGAGAPGADAQHYIYNSVFSVLEKEEF